MKIVIKDNWAKNLGDVAIAEAMISQMKNAFHGCEIILESAYPDITREYFKDVKIVRRLFDVSKVKYTGKVFSLKFFLNNISFIFQTISIAISAFLFVKFKRKRSKFEILNEIKSADLILSAGGDFLSKKYAYFLRLFEYNLIIKLEKPLILYAQSIGPFHKVIIPFVKRILNKADKIFARDEKTILMLKEYGVTSNVYRTADCVILLEMDDSIRAKKIISDYDTDKDTVMVVVRDTKFTDISEKEHGVYLSGMAETISYILSLGYKVIFLAANEEDLHLSQQMNKDFSFNLPIIDTQGLLPSEVKFVFSTIKLLISARMHPMIIASAAGIPVISTGYEFKMRNYMKLIGMEDYYIDMVPFEKSMLISKINALIAGYDAIKFCLQEKIKEVALLSERNIQYTKDFFKKSDKKMRVAFFMTTILEYGGGAEKYLKEQAKILSDSDDIHVDVVTMDNNFTFKINNLLRFYYFKKVDRSVHFKEPLEQIKKDLGEANYYKIGTLRELSRKLNEYDVICSKNEVLEAFIFKFLIGYKNLPPIIFGCHTTIHYSLAKTFHSKLHNLLYNSFVYKYLASGVRVFHAINSDDATRLKKLFLSRTIVKIYHPFNFDEFVQSAEKYKYNFEWDKTKFNIIWAGRLTEQKGVDDLVEIVNSINELEYGGKIVWNICGDGSEKEKILQLKNKWDNVNYFGHVENIYMANIYKNNNLFIMTSKWEGFPYNLLESQAVGLPAVSYDISGCSDMIDNGKNGFLVKSVKLFKDRILFFVKGSKLKLDIAKNIKNKFDKNLIYQELIKMFKDCEKR